MTEGFWRQLLQIWGQFLLVMSSPDGQKLLDMVEYVVKDVIDGPDQTPDNSPFYRAGAAPAANPKPPRVMRKPEEPA
jgi:hypothetical protein